MRKLTCFAALLSAAAFTAAGPASADSHTLRASVGPAFTISLTADDGSALTNVDPGTYTIVVDDKSEFHDFHLTGPGVDQATTVPDTGTTTWTVTLQDGTYTYRCDPHAATMHGTLRVGSGATETTASAPTSKPAAAKIVTLNGSVGPGFTISLKKAGVRVKRLAAGRYRFVIADRASLHSFVLEKERGGTFEKTLTTVPFIGSKSVVVTLTKGHWKYYCKPHEATMHGEFDVT
ncbi:MAG TPA: plastocyanin/azurin family copper-binding protein [Gaiellaceae bacterium]|nr:plastocyanin/azurin family copper-binding protein [Gaiellaceae bacterium]